MKTGLQAQLDAKTFEIQVKDMLSASKRSIKCFEVKNRVDLGSEENSYEIDVLATFEFMGADFKVLVECKHHKHPIKREVVQILNDRIRELGCQKGMIFATSGFQSGAISYALEHGIALITVVEGKSTYHTRSMDGPAEPPPWANIPDYVGWLHAKTKSGSHSFHQINRNLADSLDSFFDLQNSEN